MISCASLEPVYCIDPYKDNLETQHFDRVQERACAQLVGSYLLNTDIFLVLKWKNMYNIQLKVTCVQVKRLFIMNA